MTPEELNDVIRSYRRGSQGERNCLFFRLAREVRSLQQQLMDAVPAPTVVRRGASRSQDEATKRQRTKAEVLAARATVVGCCDRFADRMPCDCLVRAVVGPARVVSQVDNHGYVYDGCSICGRMDCPDHRVQAQVSRSPVLPGKCLECNGVGYTQHPRNGRRTMIRCSRGCPVWCNVCGDPNCQNPDGQH